MTVIVYRDGVIASDSAAYRQGSLTHGVRKIFKGPKTGNLYGIAGTYSIVTPFIKWLDNGEKGDMPNPNHDPMVTEYLGEDDNLTIMIINKDSKRIDLLHAIGLEIGITSDPYMAIGAPIDTALGALYMGATAKQAVKACIHYSMYANGKIETLKF